MICFVFLWYGNLTVHSGTLECTWLVLGLQDQSLNVALIFTKIRINERVSMRTSGPRIQIRIQHRKQISGNRNSPIAPILPASSVGTRNTTQLKDYYLERLLKNSDSGNSLFA
jgi:hypothetical protein